MDFTPPADLIRAVRQAARPLLLTHIYPDGDGIGSQLGLARALSELGARPRILNAHPAPEKYAFLDPGSDVEVASGAISESQRKVVNESDLLVILDTSDPERLGHLQEAAFGAPAPRCVIDHHLCRHQDSFDTTWSVPESPSTGNMVLDLLEALGVPLTPEMAVPLFVAVSTDTGWFRFANSTPAAYGAARRLVRAGVVPEEIYTRIFENSSVARIRLLGSILAGLQSDREGRIVYAVLNQAVLEEHEVGYEEMDGIIDSLKQVRGAEILFLVVELSPGRYKVSLRSKGARNVHGIAEQFGGGGHAKAAGCRLEASGDDEVIERVLAVARAEVDGAAGGARG